MYLCDSVIAIVVPYILCSKPVDNSRTYVLLFQLLNLWEQNHYFDLPVIEVRVAMSFH